MKTKWVVKYLLEGSLTNRHSSELTRKKDAVDLIKNLKKQFTVLNAQLIKRTYRQGLLEEQKHVEVKGV
jgi:hypothetical protein